MLLINLQVCIVNLFLIYLFKLHITPIWVKQLQYKSMQTYKKKKNPKPQT